MSWESPDRYTYSPEETEAFHKMHKPAAFVIVAILVCISAGFYWALKIAEQNFFRRSISAVVVRKFIDEQGRDGHTVRLRYVAEELNLPDSRLYYDSLQVGDSLYKPAGSTYFYLVERSNGVRTLRRLLNDSL